MKNILKILSSMTAVIVTLMIFSIIANANEVHIVQKRDPNLIQIIVTLAVVCISLFLSLIPFSWRLEIPDITEKNNDISEKDNITYKA